MSGRRARIERQATRGLRRVLEVLGGPPGVARALGISPQAVRAWGRWRCRRGHAEQPGTELVAGRVPRARVAEVVQACRGLVAEWELDPDGRPAEAQRAEASQ